MRGAACLAGAGAVSWRRRRGRPIANSEPGEETMRRLACVLLTALVLSIGWPSSGVAITEPKTEVEYPDMVTTGCDGQQVELEATGVGLREKTIMKVDVYTIVSYVAAGTELTGDKGIALLESDGAKQIQMDLRRGFSREKLIDAFKDVIVKNYDDTSAFQADMDGFFAYFEQDAQEDDRLVFTYVPGEGLTTKLNGEVKGVITNFEFVKALWTVWFGEEPADGGLKKSLLAQLDG
jgi:hypothetical protein